MLKTHHCGLVLPLALFFSGLGCGGNGSGTKANPADAQVATPQIDANAADRMQDGTVDMVQTADSVSAQDAAALDTSSADAGVPPDVVTPRDGRVGSDTAETGGSPGTCPAGQHDRGDHVCAGAWECAAGFHNDGKGTCVVDVTCDKDKLSDSTGKCVPVAGAAWVQHGTQRPGKMSWRAVAASADGSHLIAVPDGTTASGDFIYTSADTGKTWVRRGIKSPGPQQWRGVASSADGLKLAAAAFGGYIYLSSDAGVTWTQHAGKNDWVVVSSSSDGSKLVAAANSSPVGGGGIFTSTDAGASWKQSTSPKDMVLSFGGLAASADGNTLFLGEFSNPGRYIWRSSDAGVTWTAVGTTMPGKQMWNSLAVSADGMTVAATDFGSVWLSTDGGNTWAKRGGSHSWLAVSMSANGSKLVAAANGKCDTCTPEFIYTSTDAGVTWIPHKTSSPDKQNWVGVVSSADGNVLVGIESPGNIYVSSDAGETWNQPSPSQAWKSLASSADGTKLVAVAGFAGQGGVDLGRANPLDGGYIYTSTDGGETWVERGVDFPGNQYWTAVASSADGNRLVAAANIGFIYTSTDAGATWVQRASSQTWWALASSADGTHLIAGGLHSLYTSADAGATWTAHLEDPWIRTVASSADGTKLVAGGTGLYTSMDAGATWTKRELPDTNPRDPVSLGSSADGTKLILAAQGSDKSGRSIGVLYVSADAGATWKITGTSAVYGAVTSSADGNELVAAVEYSSSLDSFLYTSSDAGLTWTPRGPSRWWTAVASSADGSKLAAVGTGANSCEGYIYTSSGPVR